MVIDGHSHVCGSYYGIDIIGDYIFVYILQHKNILNILGGKTWLGKG